LKTPTTAPGLKRRSYIVSVAVVALGVGAVLAWRGIWRRATPPARPAARASAFRRALARPAADSTATAPGEHPLTPEEKAAALERIKRDYDEIRTKAAADYAAAGAAFPGGLSAFLRQLALLERERRADYLKVLTPAELEELEMRDSHAGDVVRSLLGDTGATPDQRRAVFELQRDFDDRYALVFDLSPGFLLARERDRQALQGQVRALLGDALFASWLRGEGKDFDIATAFAAQHGLPADVPIGLWQLRNRLVLGRLEVGANPTASPEEIRAAQAAFAHQVEIEARALLGPAATDPAATDVLSWLPKQ
jgi:hypothetical protein